jgi:ABC-type multidrug transport system ATPase subunit
LQAFGACKLRQYHHRNFSEERNFNWPKRQTSVAAQLVVAPKILFLDELTSGLDSEAGFNVMSFIKDVVKANNLIVIRSIHQSSTTTFELFDKLLLLSGGKTCYFGATREVQPYFDSIGFPMPNLTNPADFMLSLTNFDFERDAEAARARIEIQESWGSSPRASDEKSIATNLSSLSETRYLISSKGNGNSILMTTGTLLHRSWTKSRRDILVYGIRFFMYLGLAITIKEVSMWTLNTIISVN